MKFLKCSGDFMEKVKEERKFATGFCFYKYFYVFTIGCIIGYIYETIIEYIQTGTFVNKQDKTRSLPENRQPMLSHQHLQGLSQGIQITGTVYFPLILLWCGEPFGSHTDPLAFAKPQYRTAKIHQI